MAPSLCNKVCNSLQGWLVILIVVTDETGKKLLAWYKVISHSLKVQLVEGMMIVVVVGVSVPCSH